MIELSVKTSFKQGLVDITAQVQRAVRGAGVQSGVCVLYVPHTTAGITINESADPAVKEDILLALQRLTPPDLRYRHLEGNAHAHIQAALMGHSVQIPIEGGQLKLGTWQGIFFCEFDGPRSRLVWAQLMPQQLKPS